MHIEKLALINFKNYEEVTLGFSKKVNCLTGQNGSGKTNILDAIYYLSLTKSAFTNIDNQNIKFDEPFFSIEGHFHIDKIVYQVACVFKEGTKKTFKTNQQDYEKLGEHIGRFPVVLIAPNDVDVIRGGSEMRRRFFDTIICQADSHYMNDLVQYNHFLKQRNSFLKRHTHIHSIDHDLIDTYNEKLLLLGTKIHKTRKQFIYQYRELFMPHYNKLSDDKEQVEIIYQSDMDDEHYEQKFIASLKKDLALERTTMGVHKDDFRFDINDRPLKKFGSQGQQKTFLVALKMAHFEVIKTNKEFKPVLLLDDIFDKLDTTRINHLMSMVKADNFGQVFITDAREERIRSILKELGIEANFYKVSAGTIQPEDEERQALPS